MTSKLFLYIVCLSFLLLGCGYTVLKEEQNFLPDVKPTAKPTIQMINELKEYERLISTGTSRSEALNVFNNNDTRVDLNGRITIVIELYFYNRALEDTINSYNGEISYNHRTTPVSIRCSVPPEAIRPISLVEYVEKIYYPIISGHTN